ncbi:aminotransferase class I/II-fold pyridoxal phosphate-dependent enzyme [Reinekea marina]|uniref:Aminotransferase n=1 Tax=Reinekea marina TaxID=1310421 RepID=A0ABV7WQF6_9GAMM|nr:aminotransferase class I/II-fold pyridoxal phosphate-dependent enzyme [Reinekea marina]MDN3650480.1 aminotransferase class I/II-fold pyridoxal phosphate-dependent enzyme [Reinekea marina]
MQLAKRCQHISPFQVIQVLKQVVALESQGKDVIRLFVGEPDFSASPAILKAASESLKNDAQGYISSTGLAPLKQKIAQRYLRWHGLTIDPARIIVTPGGSAALQLAFLALIDSGDVVLLPEPGYPCNSNLLHMVDATSEAVYMDESNNMALTQQALQSAVSEKSKALLVASPSNPLGSVQTLEQWQALSSFCQNNGLALIADEIYHGLSFDGLAPTALEADNNAWVVQSFSKFYGMTGWRLGWLVVPENAIDACERIAQNLYLSASSVAQYAALRCFDEDVERESFEKRDELRKRRDYLTQALPEIGLNILANPDGAFYLYLDVSPYTQDSLQWCEQVLNETGVALAPGADFGGPSPNTTARLAYTVGVDRLTEAVARLKGFLAR